MAKNKYTLKHTSIMHNKKLYKAGDVIELTDEQAVRLEDFIDVVVEAAPKTAKTNTPANNNQTVVTNNNNGQEGGTDGK